jgi:hypothetical protein
MLEPPSDPEGSLQPIKALGVPSRFDETDHDPRVAAFAHVIH